MRLHRRRREEKFVRQRMRRVQAVASQGLIIIIVIIDVIISIVMMIGFIYYLVYYKTYYLLK